MNRFPAPRPLLGALALVACSAFADAPTPTGLPDYAIEFAAGWACSNFALKVEGWSGKGQYRELKDKNGYLRVAFAGTGDAWRLTNMLSGKSMSTMNNGASALLQTYQADGSMKNEIRGHALVIWYPTDLPPGPSASLVSGHVSYLLSAGGQGSMGLMQGNITDVCTALS